MSFGLLLIIILAVTVSLVWMYFVNIYEVKYVPSEELLVADDSSQLNIDVVPVNSFGNRALFRNVEADFFIEEGEELIDILSDRSETSRFTIKSKNTEGEVVILVKCKKSYLPVKIVIPIYVKNEDNYL
jgi:hypothetical protein